METQNLQRCEWQEQPLTMRHKDTVPLSGNKSRRWRLRSTPGIPAAFAASPASSAKPLASGSAGLARRLSLEEHGLYSKPLIMPFSRDVESLWTRIDKMQDPGCAYNEINHPTTKGNRGGLRSY